MRSGWKWVQSRFPLPTAGGSLTLAPRGYPQDSAALSGALEVVLAMDIRWVDVDHLGVLPIALDRELTTYDASYLYLSRFLGVPLITFDEELQAAAGSVEH